MKTKIILIALLVIAVIKAEAQENNFKKVYSEQDNSINESYCFHKCMYLNTTYHTNLPIPKALQRLLPDGDYIPLSLDSLLKLKKEVIQKYYQSIDGKAAPIIDFTIDGKIETQKKIEKELYYKMPKSGYYTFTILDSTQKNTDTLISISQHLISSLEFDTTQQLNVLHQLHKVYSTIPITVDRFVWKTNSVQQQQELYNRFLEKKSFYDYYVKNVEEAHHNHQQVCDSLYKNINQKILEGSWSISPYHFIKTKHTTTDSTEFLQFKVDGTFKHIHHYKKHTQRWQGKWKLEKVVLQKNLIPDYFVRNVFQSFHFRGCGDYLDYNNKKQESLPYLLGVELHLTDIKQIGAVQDEDRYYTHKNGEIILNSFSKEKDSLGLYFKTEWKHPKPFKSTMEFNVFPSKYYTTDVHSGTYSKAMNIFTVMGFSADKKEVFWPVWQHDSLPKQGETKHYNFVPWDKNTGENSVSMTEYYQTNKVATNWYIINIPFNTKIENVFPDKFLMRNAFGVQGGTCSISTTKETETEIICTFKFKGIYTFVPYNSTTKHTLPDFTWKNVVFKKK